MDPSDHARGPGGGHSFAAWQFRRQRSVSIADQSHLDRIDGGLGLRPLRNRERSTGAHRDVRSRHDFGQRDGPRSRDQVRLQPRGLQQRRHRGHALAAASTLPGSVGLSPPAPPGNFAGYAITNTQIRLNWTISPTAIGYDLYQIINGKPARIANYAVNLMSAAVINLSPGTTYAFNLVAYNTAGTAATPWIQVTTRACRPAARRPPRRRRSPAPRQRPSAWPRQRGRHRAQRWPPMPCLHNWWALATGQACSRSAAGRKVKRG